MIDLHEHQEKFVNEIRDSMRRRNKAICCVAPTGMGKTVCASYMINEATRKGSKIHFLVHRRDLIRQTAYTLDQFGVNYSYIAAGHAYNPYSRVHICSIDTFRNRLDKVPVPNLAMFDEGHLACSPTWSKAIDHYKAHGTWILTFTATPIRTDGTGLGKHFTDMICGPDIAWLMENGFLSKYLMYAPSAPDLSGIATRAGEFAKDQLCARMDADNVLIGDAVRHYEKYAMGRLAIAYCVSRKHSENVAAQFRNAGIPAQHIDGETPMDERTRIIRAFARREILVLTNVALISTGFDVAASAGVDVTVECIIDLAPTKSTSLCLQKWGRGLRRKPYPAILLDHAANWTRHGRPDDPRQWTLADSERKQSKSEEKAIPTINARLASMFPVRPPPARTAANPAKLNTVKSTTSMVISQRSPAKSTAARSQTKRVYTH
jgi:DNA repair protein RadD